MKKILIINILLVILLNSFYVCFAKENNLEIIKYEKDCQNYLIYQGIPKTAHYAFYEKDGLKMPAYCINPEYNGVNSEMPEYAVSINGKIKNEKVWKVIVNGYPYKTIEELGVNCKEEAYTATQFAIYTVLHNRNVEDYTHDNTDAGKRTLNAYLKIMENVNKMNEEMNLKIEIESISEQWDVDCDKNEYLSKEFIVRSNISDASYKINLKGEYADKLEINSGDEEKNSFKVNEKFKILVPINLLADNMKFEIEVNGTVNSNPILFGETMIEETQNYALTGNYEEDFSSTLIENVPKNTSQIKIIKKEMGNDKKLEGVKFNLLNSNKDSVVQNLITDYNGEIILENLMPGIYYLQEAESLDGYELNSELIEIDLQINEKIEIVVENKLEEKIEPKQEIIVQEVKTLPVTGY